MDSLPPLSLIQTPPWSKHVWSCLVKSRITNWYETELRQRSLQNSKMKYLNVNLLGLSGAPHPAVRNICSNQDAKKLRLHLKFLTSDILTNERLSLNQPHHSAACTLCYDPLDSIEHIMATCRATDDVRGRLLPELLNVVARVQPLCAILEHQTYNTPSILTQFVLDCSSLNLPDKARIPANHPHITDVFRISRDWAFAIYSERTRLVLENCH